MKSEIIENKKRFYPRLMKTPESGIVVCFTSEKCGVVVHPVDHNDFMKFYDDWTMEWFVEFDGKIFISN